MKKHIRPITAALLPPDFWWQMRGLVDNLEYIIQEVGQIQEKKAGTA